MLKRLLLVAFCILFVPMLVLIPYSENSKVASPAGVVFAGHSQAGGVACTCGCPGCVCDPGEPSNCSRTAETSGLSDDKTLGDKTPTSEADYGAAALFLALALFVWLRLRA